MSKYLDIFKEASQKYGLPMDLLVGQAVTESNLDPNAVSEAGAGGIMQLMPGTARDLGVDDVFDPHKNIMGGAKYMRQMLDMYGNYGDALTAYHAGPGNMNAGNLGPRSRAYPGTVLKNANKYGGDMPIDQRAVTMADNKLAEQKLWNNQAKAETEAAKSYNKMLETKNQHNLNQESKFMDKLDDAGIMDVVMPLLGLVGGAILGGPAGAIAGAAGGYTRKKEMDVAEEQSDILNLFKGEQLGLEREKFETEQSQYEEMMNEFNKMMEDMKRDRTPTVDTGTDTTEEVETKQTIKLKPLGEL